MRVTGKMICNMEMGLKDVKIFVKLGVDNSLYRGEYADGKK